MSEDEIILTHILQCRPIDLVLDKPALTPAQQKQFEDNKSRRQAGEPMQYILGTCNFMGFELAVNPSVLIPRPETEQLVDAAIKHLEISFPKSSIGNTNQEFIRILDLGTGSGNIAIVLSKFITQARIVSVDISAPALEVAKANARYHGIEDRIEFIQRDMFAILSEAKELNDNNLFDLIIANPPYIPTGQLSSLPRDVQQEPSIALDGGEDGLNFYRNIIKYTPYLLRGGACLMMEFGDACLPARYKRGRSGRDSCPQSDEILAMMEETKSFSKIEILKDLAGRDRIIKTIR